MMHESALKHVTGQSVYVDDLPVSDQLLVGHVVYSPHAHARVVSFDLEAARRTPGAHAVLCYRDIPGVNQMGPVVHDEACLAEHEVQCIGQAVFLIAAEDDEACRAAAARIAVTYEELEPIVDLETAMKRNSLLGPPRCIERGNVDSALLACRHRIQGELHTGAQEHWYLETQACLCVPGEDREINVFSSTQHPSETQAIVAEVLGVPKHDVVVEVRRMGGAFGGKETQANHVAAWCALLCGATGRPVKIRLFRDDDQIMTGKRHRFIMRYDAGFDDQGVLEAVRLELHADGGCATDLSFAILERAMLHSDNAYFIPNFRVDGHVWKTNLPSNTAFRGFGGPQGMAIIEQVVDRVARHLKMDAVDVRRRNYYGIHERQTTPYGQVVEDNHLILIHDKLLASSGYVDRRRQITQFNARNEFYKKGMAMTPVKFGISFTTSYLNQAGALVHVYKDGSVLVHHGGTEMGQGLHTKIRQIAAREFGISLERVKVHATNTSHVPNTSATAASAGTDLNGMAVQHAIATLKDRFAEPVAAILNERFRGTPSSPGNILFQDDMICDRLNPARRIGFAEVMPLLHFRQISLSATGYYRTPDIHFDRATGHGKPFHYYAFGMAVTEVLVDTLTGRHTILRTDILHDVGDSINSGIDLGQIEGGYVQGVGWCTTEEIKWDDRGRLLTHSPDTYKIPGVQDIPRDFRTELLTGVPNPKAIHGSKAVAEPPFMLALSCWLAIKDAVSAVAIHEVEPDFSLPATHEVILLSIEKLKPGPRSGA